MIHDANRWAQIQELFYQALEMPAHERDSWLRQRCAHDVSLWQEVASLLAADDQQPDDVARGLKAPRDPPAES